MKKIGFLSFGHWTPSPHSQVRTASDAHFAVAAEELGADGAFFRVHHYARQLGSPFPLLAAVAARTEHIEIGTAPGIHVFSTSTGKSWMAGTSPAMTTFVIASAAKQSSV
jgi:Luciferase-like monooxygenase